MKILVAKTIGILSLLILSIVIFSQPVSAATYSVINTANSGAGSFRQAIIDANTNAGADIIDFNIPGAGVHTIAPSSNFPDITDQVTIDGLTQPGATCGTLVPAILPAANNTPHNLLIELNATSMVGGSGDQTGALRLANTAASNSIIRGLVINRVTNSVFDGIMLRADVGQTLSDVLIECNYIGTDTAGTTAPGGFQFSSGVLQYNNGGTITNSTASNNLISGMVFGFQASGSWLIENNLLGTNATGTGAIGSLGPGVFIGSAGNYSGNSTVRHNIVGGGTGAGASGISQNGVENMTIDDNYVGVDITGLVAIPNENGIDGVGFGESTTVTNNLISGNNLTGIYYYSGYLGPNDISNNRIGVDVNNNPLGNGDNGITIQAFADVVFNIHDNNISNNTGMGISAIQNTALPSLAIYNNTLTDNTIDGIRTISSGLSITSNTISGSGNAGINAFAGLGNLDVQSNIVTNIGGTGIYINSGANTVSSNSVNNIGGIGISTNGTSLTAQNNQTNNNGGAGFDMGASNISANNNVASNNGDYGFSGGGAGTFSNNTATNNGDNGISLNGNGLNITSNLADSNGQSGFNLSGTITMTDNQSINNSLHGISVGSVDSTIIAGNYIGLTSAGVVASNGGDGIFVQESNSVTIGGNTEPGRNYISANNGSGIHLFACGSDVTQGVNVIGNYIGTNTSGDITAGYGNGGSGIQINEQELFGCGGGGGGGSIYHNTIGGDGSGEPNLIAGNAEDGVRVFQAPNTDVFSNTLLPNVIFGNANLGMNLASDTDNDGTADTDLGPNPLNNDLMTYPAINANYYLNRPVIISGNFVGNQLTVKYDLQANQADNSSLLQSDIVGYRLDFYINDNAQNGAYAGYNQSKAHIGSFIVNGSETGATHVFTTSEALTTGKSINATATVLWKNYTCPNDDDKSGNGPPYGDCGGGGGGGG